MTAPAMARLVVEQADAFVSVQDRGRFGAQRYGLVPSGAMDRFSLAAANALVGEKPEQPAIEIGPLGARFSARDGAVRLGIAGALRAMSVDDRPLVPGESILLGEGSVLTVGPARGGMFSYLAIEGGLSGQPDFGSFSVNARAGLGSPYPRNLRAGDELEIPVDPRRDVLERRLPVEPAETGPIRVVLGPQEDYFTAKTIAAFFAGEWRVGASSDRMGYRLEGPRLEHAKGFNIVSDGTVDGHIQVPGSGQPLVLLRDRGTTGGYPKLGAIISADLGRFVQTPPGEKVAFRQVSIEEAQAAAREFAARIAAMPLRLQPLLGGRLSSEALLAVNLAGQAVSATDPATWRDVDPAFSVGLPATGT